jgi:hypothetical protein
MEKKKKIMSKVFPESYPQLIDFLVKEDLTDKVEALIEEIKDKYIKKHCDDSFDFIAHDGIWNTIAEVIEGIAQENQ